MRKTIRIAAMIAALTTCTILPLSAATPSEFYASLLRKGVAAYDAERYDEASRQLRIAAFGLVDAIESYELAQVYLTLAWDKLGQPDRVAEAARRVVVAERIERRYSALQIPAAVRTAFERIAGRVLSPGEMAGLRGTAPLPPAPAQPSRVTTVTRPATTTTPPPAAATMTTSTTTQTTQPPVTVERVEVEVAKPATTTNPTQPPAQPATTTTQPAQPATTTTQPRTTNPPATTTPAPQQPRTATPPPQTTTTQPPVTQPRTTTTTPPPATTTTQPPRTTTAPSTQPPRTTTTQPATPTTRVAPTFTAGELASRFAAGERALVTSNLPEARRIYREVLESANLSHDNALRVAEGLYRARDFASALAAFDRAGTLRRGEEPYRYYIAVASYETGQIARAKRELSAALPFIELTPDVARNRAKIESAIAQ